MTRDQSPNQNRKTPIVNVLLGLLVFLSLLSALEVGGRLIERRRPARRVADYIWNWDERWGGDFYTVSTRTRGWPPTLEFNDQGLRDRTHPREKLDLTWRLVFLGDSVTMGDTIDARQAFPQSLASRFENEGRRIEVFNVALWGWSTRQERIAYERLVRPFKPDQIILGVCLNDIPELQNNLSRPPRWLTWLHERSAFARLIVNAPGREIASVEELFADPDHPKVLSACERFFDEMRLLRRTVLADGARFNVLVFPFRIQVEDGAPDPIVQRRIAAFCERESIPFLDLLPTLKRIGPSAFNDYDHLSPDGARLVADEIEGSGWLPRGYSFAEATKRIAEKAPDASAWIETLRTSPDAVARHAAAWALGRTSEIEPDAIDALRTALAHDRSRDVRSTAARAIGAHLDASRLVAPSLFSALVDTSENVRYDAAQALARCDLDSSSDVPHLIATLASGDAYVRDFAAWKLSEFGNGAAAAVPPLTAMIEQERDESGLARRALARIGVASQSAIPTLAALLRHADFHERADAVRALGGAGGAKAVEALITALSDENGIVRSEAARALGRIGADSQPAVSRLTELLSDPDDQVRAMAARALGFIPEASLAVPQLNSALLDENPRVAREARKALRRIHAAQ